MGLVQLTAISTLRKSQLWFVYVLVWIVLFQENPMVDDEPSNFLLMAICF